MTFNTVGICGSKSLVGAFDLSIYLLGYSVWYIC